MRNKILGLYGILCLLTIILILITSFFLFLRYPKTETADEEITESQTEIPETPARHELTLIAAGDNLFHITIIEKALENGQYNFEPIYSEIKNIVMSADIAFINQETVMAGSGFGYSGYPLFNTPQSLAKTLADTGFNIFNLANNHAMDKGKSGLVATLDYLDTIENITVIGARKTGDSHKIIMKNEITLGFLSYTYGLNGHALPADSPNLVSIINREKIATEIAALRPLCDFLIVSLHWGEEYSLIEPNAYQKNLAAFLSELNVDLIIGHHPHVLQRAETLERGDGGKTLCFYSIGNFVSHQREKDRTLGAIMFAVFTKEDEELAIADAGLTPVICHFETGHANTKVYPLNMYTEESLNKHLVHKTDKGMNLDHFYSVLDRLNTKIKTRY